MSEEQETPESEVVALVATDADASGAVEAQPVPELLDVVTEQNPLLALTAEEIAHMEQVNLEHDMLEEIEALYPGGLCRTASVSALSVALQKLHDKGFIEHTALGLRPTESGLAQLGDE